MEFSTVKSIGLWGLKAFRAAQLKAFLSEASIMQTGILFEFGRMHAVVTKGVRSVVDCSEVPCSPR